MNNLTLGGGSWTCEKCGKTIQGTSIYHECITNKKQNMHTDLLDWAYDAYTNFEKQCIPGTGKKMSIEEFVNFIKTDSAFAKNWGVSVNRRELTLAERKKIYSDIHIPGFTVEENAWLDSKLRAHNIPKHVITLTHNNKIIEVYE
jgi:hypothetical protein